MEINFTLIGQLITFAVLVFFTMKYVWPPILKAMQEREKTIADGLAAAEKGQRDLELARHKSKEIIQEAKLEGSRIIDQANKRATNIIAEGKQTAKQEVDRMLAAAKEDISQMTQQAKRELQNHISELAISMAEKVLQRGIDADTHRKLLDKMVAEIE